jgi:hypothetical protein
MNGSNPDRLSGPIYHTYEELLQDLDQLRSLDRGGFVDRSVTEIGRSPDGRWRIPVIKIGRNPAHRAFIFGNDHAREWIAAEVPYLLAELLVKVANDIAVHPYYDRYKDKIKQLAREREVWIAPMLNPEGNGFTHLPGHENWRKNRRHLGNETYTTRAGDTLQLLYEFFGPNSGVGENFQRHVSRRIRMGDRGIANWEELARVNAQQLTQRNISTSDPSAPLPAGMTLQIPVYGVDLNRNYPYQWNSNLDFSTGEVTTQPEDQTDDGYPGTEAASEYEVQAVIRLFTQAAKEKRPFQSALSYHNFAEVVLYPWGYQRNPTDRQAVADFAGYMAGLINQARNPAYLAEIQRAKEAERNALGTQVDENSPTFLESWLRSARRQFYFHANPGALSFGGDGGSFMDWAHQKWDGMPVYTIELSPRPSDRGQSFQGPTTQILPVFRENLPTALALIEYENFQRRAQRRGKCYRCHLFSYAGPQTEGVLSQWTQNLQPVGDRTVLSGEVVELFTTINAGVYPITEQARVRFDILEEDHFLTGGLDDRILSFLGTGVTRAAEGFTPENKTTVFRRLEAGQTIQSHVERFKQTQPGYRNNILILEETRNGDSRHHLISWWTAQRLEDYANSEFYFIVNVNDAFEDQSEAILDVSSTAIPTGASIDDRVRAALLRINEHLGRGVTDWAVTDAEALAVLQILNGLEPEVLLRTVQTMRVGGSWETFRSNLPRSEALMQGLVSLERKISPNTGYLAQGDRIKVTVVVVSVGGRVSEDAPMVEELRVEANGARLSSLPNPVPLIGLLPEDAVNAIAAAYIDQMILRNPSVKLEIIERGSLYAMAGAFSPQEFRSTSRLDPNSPETRRLRKQEIFINYIEGQTGRDRFTLNALSQYMKWLSDNFGSEEYLSREPEELWSWALQLASIPPPIPPVMPYLAISRQMLARAQEATDAERRMILEALDWFHAWLDSHRSDEELSRHSANAVWLRAWRKAIDADIERTRIEIERRVREERERAEFEAYWQAAGDKLDKALELMMKRVWQLPEPEVINAPSEGVGYLVMPSEAEREVRDLIARGFLSDFMRRMGEMDPGFTRTMVEEDFLAYLDARPELKDALWLTQSHPYVEKFALEREIPGWQTAISVAIGFIPIVGQVVGAYEVIAGEDIFGNELSGTERAIIGAAILLPAAGKIYKVGSAAVTSSRIASAYRLSTQEANALFRATAGIRPGSVGERLLTAAKSDIRAGRAITDEQRIKDLGALLQEMGMTESATARTLNAARRTAQQAVRRVDRLDLARTVPNLTAAERNLLESMGEDAWSRLFGYASTRTNSFAAGGAARTGAAASLKGKIAEELFPLTSEFDDAMRAAREQAAREGIPADSVQFVTNVVSDMPVGSPFPRGELTDGVIVAFHNNKARVLGVIESKSPSNLRDLAAARSEYFGQIEKDLDRFSMFEVSFNGRVFQPEDIVISRHNTQWVGVAPPGLELGTTHLQRIQSGFPGFRLVNGPILNERLNEVAEEILRLLSQSQ